MNMNSFMKATLFVGLLSVVAYLLLQFALVPKIHDLLGISRNNTTALRLINRTAKGRNSTKIILFWTKRSSAKNWFTFPEAETSRSLANIARCDHANYILTSDRARLKDADLLLFYLNAEPDWPRLRYVDQLYAHFIHEPPGSRGRRTFLDKYEGKVDVTINYRRDADLYVPYGVVVPAERTDAFTARVPHGRKTKMVVWPVSHCTTESRREDYVKELARYIEVDTYGACGSHRCARARTSSCLSEWESAYRFYLSFENNVCEDYITEKLFKPLQYELIPVVLGGGNYSRDAPPNSVIDARDFGSPEMLAEFLTSLAADEERYRSYFEWKSHYRIDGGTHWFLCRLCDALYDDGLSRHLSRTHYADYWYGADGEKCDNQLVPRMRSRGKW